MASKTSNGSVVVDADDGKASHLFERFFYWWGRTVASNPWKFIAATLVMTGLGSLGLLDFKAETTAGRCGSRRGAATR